MAFLTVGKENSADIQLYYEDRGSGKPVLLIHGWPLAGGSWERQAAVLLASGFRVITYDRRGFGRSSAPSVGYDYDTLANDTAKLIDKLGLRDVALVGFSMGGGEVARYMSKSGQGISKTVFISAITPALRKDGNNPDGVDPGVFEEMKAQLRKDRFAFLDQFLHDFYNKRLLGGTHISNQAIQASWNVAAAASYGATLLCIDSWLEDFRRDVATIKVPTLVIHGDDDLIVPLETSGARMPKLVSGAQLHVVRGGPHGCTWTHATEVNKALLGFLH